MARKPMTLKRILLFLALIVIVAAIRYYQAPPTETVGEQPAGSLTVEEAADQRVSGIMLDVTGVVRQSLADDNEGSRHQRFIVELPSGHTVLVAHNIDLADRVPLKKGDRVTVRGQFEWNDRGGVLHWTHHDPAGRHEGGWIELDGQKYQ